MGLFDGILGGIGGLVGSFLNNKAADDAADQAWDRQKKVLTKQIQWRVADAQKAGIHPLAALGVNPASGPPMANIAGGDFSGPLAQMGQDIGRAAEAYAAPEDKAAVRMTQLQLERGQLENDLLRTQIASQRVRLVQQGTPGLNPGTGVLPIPGTGGPSTKDDARIGVDYPGLGDAWEKDFGDNAAVDAIMSLATMNALAKSINNGQLIMGSNAAGHAGAVAKQYLDRLIEAPPYRPTYYGRWGRR